MSDEKAEELEVLQSILEAADLTLVSDDELIVRVEPEMDSPGQGQYAVALHVAYTPAYPQEPPRLSVKAYTGELSDADLQELERSVTTEAEACLGMAMVYTLAMALKEQLTRLLAKNAAQEAEREADAAQAAHEAELARARGTPVTPANFNAWRIRFIEEMKAVRLKEEEERLKAMPTRERDEARRAAGKLTGKQLFERNRNLDTSDVGDVSHYERDDEIESEDSEGQLSLSDSE